MFSKCLLSCLIVVACSLTASAQTPPDEGNDVQPRGERGQRGEDRGRGEGRGEGRRRGPNPERMFDRLAEELELDETQRAQLDQIREGHRQEMEPIRQKWEAVREAREAGNDELADQLRDELRSEMQANGGRRAMMEKLVEQLEPILTEEQKTKLGELRERFEQHRQERQRQRQTVEEIPDEVGMDDAQREQYQAVRDEMRSQMRERFSQMRQLGEAMREAREAGDDVKVQELEAQMEQLRPDRANMEDEFYSRVEQILRDDQKALLAQYRESVSGQDAGRERARESELPEDIRIAIKAASKLDLSREQKREMREIQRDAREAYREARKTDRENRSREREAEKKLIVDVQAKILRLLDAEQAEKYQAEVEKLNKRVKRRSVDV